MIKFITCFLLIFSIIYTQQPFETIEKFPDALTNQYFVDNGWSHTLSDQNSNYADGCGVNDYLGGANTNMQDFMYYRKTASNLPKHSLLTQKFTLWIVDIDPQDQSTLDRLDFQVHIRRGEEREKVFSVRDFVVDGETTLLDLFQTNELCGNGELLELIGDFELGFEHTDDTIELEYSCSDNMTWGIQGLEFQSQCEFQVGDRCFSLQELQRCTQILRDLDPAEFDNSSCVNFCEVKFADDGEIFYEFIIQFNAPFVYDIDCFTSQVFFSGVEIFEGPNFFDQYSLDLEKQILLFNIRHRDVVPVYNCDHNVEDDQQTWLCRSSLILFFGGLRQTDYNFKIQVTLSTEVIGTNQPDPPVSPGPPDGEDPVPTTVTVIKNIVSGDCCKNQLDILTKLEFCTDFTCNEKIDTDKLTIKRGDDVFVEHSIITNEFKDYLLRGISINLGPFVPLIIDEMGLPGRYIYHIRPTVASNNLALQVVSKVGMPMAPSTFRVLQEQELGVFEDYTIRDQQIVDVQVGEVTTNISDDNNEGQEGVNEGQSEKVIIEKKKEKYDMLAIGVSVLVALVVLLGAIICYYGSAINKNKIKYNKLVGGKKLKEQGGSKNSIEK